jgi:hypothetical protein
LATVVLVVLNCHPHASPELANYFQQNVKLSPDQIAALSKGQAVAKTMVPPPWCLASAERGLRLPRLVSL